MFKRLIASLVCLAFFFTNLRYVHAQEFSINQLPVPGAMVGESGPYAPLVLKGLIVNPHKPLEFQFIVDTGIGPRAAAFVNQEANRLVKYFLAGLTIPEGDLWVNLSPYEKDRITTVSLGQTELGRDLLAQDYILKQLTASLIYPEKALGKEFWSRVYSRARQQFGTTDVAVSTFNKVWILPDEAQVYENGAAAYVTGSTLKVMLDEDYTALSRHSEGMRNTTEESKGALRSLAGAQDDKAHTFASQIVREIVIPAITKEVNTGKNFAPLRQIYDALILAKWYKETIANGLLDALYTNHRKIAGVELADPTIKEQIYRRYLQAYKKGVFNYIKEDVGNGGQAIPKKYFSGGTNMAMTVDHHGSAAMVSAAGAMLRLDVDLQKPADAAMHSRSRLIAQYGQPIANIAPTIKAWRPTNYPAGVEIHLNSHQSQIDDLQQEGLLSDADADLMRIFVEGHDYGYSIDLKNEETLKQLEIIWGRIGRLVLGYDETKSKDLARRIRLFMAQNSNNYMVNPIIAHGTTSILPVMQKFKENGLNDDEAFGMALMFAADHPGFPITMVYRKNVKAGAIPDEFLPVLLVTDLPQKGLTNTDESLRQKVADAAAKLLKIPRFEARYYATLGFALDRITSARTMTSFSMDNFVLHDDGTYEGAIQWGGRGETIKKYPLIITNMKDPQELTVAEVFRQSIEGFRQEAAAARRAAELMARNLPHTSLQDIEDLRQLIDKRSAYEIDQTQKMHNDILTMIGQELPGFSGDLREIDLLIRQAMALYSQIGVTKPVTYKPSIEYLLGFLITIKTSSLAQKHIESLYDAAMLTEFLFSRILDHNSGSDLIAKAQNFLAGKNYLAQVRLAQAAMKKQKGEIIESMLKSRDIGFRWAAREALDTMGTDKETVFQMNLKVLTMVSSRNTDEALQDAIIWLGQSRDQRAVQQLAAKYFSTTNDEIQESILEALKKLGAAGEILSIYRKELPQKITEAIKDLEDPQNLRQALVYLAAHPDNKFLVSELRQLKIDIPGRYYRQLNSLEKNEQYIGIRLLEAFEDPRGINALSSIIKYRQGPHLHDFFAACALAHIGFSRVESLLLTYLGWPTFQQYHGAEKALQALQTDRETMFRGYEKVLKEREPANWTPRQNAARQLVKMREARAIELFQALLKDSGKTPVSLPAQHDRLTALNGLESFRKMGFQVPDYAMLNEAAAPQNQDPAMITLDKMIVFRAQRKGDIDKVVNMMEHRDIRVRHVALDAFDRMAVEPEKRHKVALDKLKSRYFETRAWAVANLNEWCKVPQQFFEAGSEGLKMQEDFFRIWAIRMLVKSGKPEVLPMIEGLFNDEDPYLSEAAIKGAKILKKQLGWEGQAQQGQTPDAAMIGKKTVMGTLLALSLVVPSIGRPSIPPDTMHQQIINPGSVGQISPLILYSWNGDRQKVEQLIAQGVDINMTASDGTTALMIAAYKGHKGIVEVLLANGADANLQRNDGATALIAASQNGYPQIAALLLQKGAQVDARRQDGATALMLASQLNRLEVVKLLLAKGADVNAKAQNGGTALMLAVLSDNPPLIQLLLQKGADVRARANNGATALSTVMVATTLEHQQEIIDILLQAARDQAMSSSAADREKQDTASMAMQKQTAENGGIDFNAIGIKRRGQTINVPLDPDQLNELVQGGFEGLAPVIIDMAPIASPLALLGIKPAAETGLLAKV